MALDKMRRDFDPIGSFRFGVEIKGWIQGRFQEVSGLSFEVKPKEYNEGGLNTHTHKLPGPKKYPNLKLKRGYVNGSDFYDWFTFYHFDGIVGPRKDGAIIIFDRQANELHRWNFKRAWPVKWEGPSLNSNQDSILVESLEIAHEGMWFQG